MRAFAGSPAAVLPLSAGGALAHPHGRMVAVGPARRFDELVRATPANDIDRDRNGRFHAAETARTEREAFAAPAELDWPKRLRVDGRPVEPHPPSGVVGELEARLACEALRASSASAERRRRRARGGLVTCRLERRLSAPIDPRAASVALTVADPSRHVEPMLDPEAPARLLGEAPASRELGFEPDTSPANVVVPVPPVGATLVCRRSSRAVRKALALLLLPLAQRASLAASDGPGNAEVTPSGPAEPTAACRSGGALADFQRTADREIAKHPRAIRDGQGGGPLPPGLLLALLSGAAHAAGPGHGELVVAGYFLSREARIARALATRAQTALLDVVSAIVIVGFADFLLRRAFGGVPVEIPAVRIASSALVFASGPPMLARAGRRSLAGGDETGHDRVADHAQPHRHRAGCGCGAHAPPRAGGLLALPIGLVPREVSLLILFCALADDTLLEGLLPLRFIALGTGIRMGGLGLASVWARRFLFDRAEAARPAVPPGCLLELRGAGPVTVVGGLLSAGSL
jgi:ABC-type nickel/cobalt efflux system permease component RcnA